MYCMYNETWFLLPAHLLLLGVPHLCFSQMQVLCLDTRWCCCFRRQSWYQRTLEEVPSSTQGSGQLVVDRSLSRSRTDRCSPDGTNPWDYSLHVALDAVVPICTDCTFWNPANINAFSLRYTAPVTCERWYSLLLFKTLWQEYLAFSYALVIFYFEWKAVQITPIVLLSWTFSQNPYQTHRSIHI